MPRTSGGAVEALAEIMRFQAKGAGWCEIPDDERQVWLLAADKELRERLRPAILSDLRQELLGDEAKLRRFRQPIAEAASMIEEPHGPWILLEEIEAALDSLDHKGGD
jgi:hypothetical protein